MIPRIIIKLNKFTLRPFSWADTTSLANYANDSRVATFLRPSFPYPYTSKDAEEYIYFCLNAQDAFVLAIDINHEAVGSIGVQYIQFVGKSTWELGYWLGVPFWNQGIMSDAVKNFIHYLAFYLNTDEIIAKVYSLNIGSIKVLENNGFKKINLNETTRIRTGQLVEEWVFMKNLERHIFR